MSEPRETPVLPPGLGTPVQDSKTGPVHCTGLDGECMGERAKATTGGSNTSGMDVHQLTQHTEGVREGIKEA